VVVMKFEVVVMLWLWCCYGCRDVVVVMSVWSWLSVRVMVLLNLSVVMQW